MCVTQLGLNCGCFCNPGCVIQVPGSSVCVRRSGRILLALRSCGQFCGAQDVPALLWMEQQYVWGGRLTATLVLRILSAMN